MSEKTKRPAKATQTAAATVPDVAVTASKAVKVEAVTKAAPIVPSSKVSKGEKHKKQKMVRDSFTMPESDYGHIAALKERCLKAGVSAKKSEVLRAALSCLANLSDKALIKAIADLEIIKTGRPAKNRP
ncbi:MAG TPA: hypothetical protein VGK14_10910 [Novimethylophilus sp.]|jgi:hypothetical protein|uniref:hypothetical protein n=1 Tax=Novimethylophilus sp. TaxID=2137426 RepID=UPI002F3FA3FB